MANTDNNTKDSTAIAAGQIPQTSYISIIQDINRFRGSGRSDNHLYDFPSNVFFKILFHFENGTDVNRMEPGTLDEIYSNPNNNAPRSGLLGPSWIGYSSIEQSINSYMNFYDEPTAYSYFIINDDRVRAQNTRKFVELLSNINSYTPWYFQNIKGLEAAINREMVTTGDFQIKPERDKITIECLEDSYDQRIGTLLDLYRSIVWSWETKREMLPANLRKFDMTIVLFEMPIRGQHVPRNIAQMKEADIRSVSKQIVETTSGFAVIYDNNGSSAPVASYKAYEFHGCEIDYNSSKSGAPDINNERGVSPKYSIDVYFDNMYEIRFNEYLGMHITDLVGDTTAISVNSELLTYNAESPGGDHSNTAISDDVNSEDKDGAARRELAKASNETFENTVAKISAEYHSTEIPDSVNIAQYTPPSNSIIGQVVGGLTEWGKTKLKKIYLGNIYGLSIAKIGQQLNEAAKGNLGATVGAISGYVKGNWDGGNKTDLSTRDIFPDPEPNNNKPTGNLYRSTINTNTILNS